MKTYKDCGVDVEKGDQFVDNIKEMVQSTYNKSVHSGVGGFASLYDLGNGKFLAAGTDGVGTKLKIASILGIHDTIGIDLVAMCVNDIICTGAKPLFFLDYFASSKLKLEVSTAVVKGIVEGCKQSSMALIGGETAEMPGMYNDEEYDLAGFAVGIVNAENILDGKQIKPGDKLIAVESSGLHSNGYSLIRSLVEPHETELLKSCLTPTLIYTQLMSRIYNEFGRKVIKGIAHITGGGVDNIKRMSSNVGYNLTNLPELSPVVEEITKRSQLPKIELYKTFNMGMGLVLATSAKSSSKVVDFINSSKYRASIVGDVTDISGQLTF